MFHAITGVDGIILAPVRKFGQQKIECQNTGVDGWWADIGCGCQGNTRRRGGCEIIRRVVVSMVADNVRGLYCVRGARARVYTKPGLRSERVNRFLSYVGLQRRVPFHEGKNMYPTTMPSCAKEFIAYCETEYERRTSSDDVLDESLFRSAVDLVMRKLCNTEHRKRI